MTDADPDPLAAASAPEPLADIAAVLAGGAARRMGGSKHDRLGPGGVTLLAAAVAAAAGAARRVIVAGRPPGVLGDSIEVSGIGAVPIVDDGRPGEGPVAGLETALVALTALASAGPGGGTVLVVPCDMPRLRADDLRRLLGGGALAVHHAGHPLPLALAAAARPHITRFLDAGERRLSDLLARLDPRVIDLPRGATARLVNVNRPEDLAGLDAD